MAPYDTSSSICQALNAGMLCDVAGNGKEALAAIENATYHIVLMDFMMPEMDGATATRLLRKMEAEKGLRRLPVIGISATLTNEAPCIAAGMDRCIQKPIKEAELLKMVDTFIAHDDHGASVDGSGGAVVGSRPESPAEFRVMLAEDSKANQMAISRLLKAQGVVVTVVDDGSVAVEKLVNEKAAFDLAFFDINMPIMGGVEALRQAGRCRLTVSKPVLNAPMVSALETII